MSETHQPPADDRIYESDGLDAELFWAKHRQSIIIGAIVVVLAVGGTVGWFINAHNTKLASQKLFAASNSPEAWREVIAKYPASQPASDAYFLLAESLREQGNVSESSATFQKFLSTFPDHELAGGARLGLAENLSAEGKTEEALAALREVQTKNPTSYAAPFATLLEGRIYLRQGKLVDARRVFLNLVSTYQKSPVAQVAHAQIDQIGLILPPDAPKPTQ